MRRSLFHPPGRVKRTAPVAALVLATPRPRASSRRSARLQWMNASAATRAGRALDPSDRLPMLPRRLAAQAAQAAQATLQQCCGQLLGFRWMAAQAAQKDLPGQLALPLAVTPLVTLWVTL